ncbi:MAG: thymidylate synthase [Planctomycetes bacterium]|nr:thymidylate synthase [Planctomycetota bacterium]
MKQYLDLLQHVRAHGVRKPTRGVLRSTGEKIDALSVFGYQMRFDLNEGFPAVTTKKLAFNAVVHELLWFLKGSTNVGYLRDNNVTIWDEWADASGSVGPIYGKQWRSWQAPDGQTFDQIANLLAGIEAVKKDPTAAVGRRLVVSAWNPPDVPKMSVPACHTLFQFCLTEGRLSCQLYQRSADSFLGVPFNIASYALLTHLVAHVGGVGVGEFIHTFGDVHIYTNHLEQVEEQLKRRPYPLPRLGIDPSVKSLDNLERRQITLLDYRHHPPLAGEVAV